MANIVGVDISRHQGNINWQTLKQALLDANQGGAGFVVMRATVGDYYTDERLTEYWQAAGEYVIPQSAYHVIAPERPAIAQTNRFLSVVETITPTFSLLHNNNEIAPWWLDCELTRNQSRQTITHAIWYAATQIAAAGIYTRASWWDVNVNRWSGWRDKPLWVAHYGAAQPTLPADWGEWVVWQYSANGNGMGAAFGVQSHDIDINQMRPESLPGPRPPTLEDRVTRLEMQAIEHGWVL